VSEEGLIDRIIGLKIEFVVSAPANKNGKRGTPESHEGNDGRNTSLTGRDSSRNGSQAGKEVGS
jgi:hypothetical protein